MCALTFADLGLKNASIAVSRLKGSLRTIQPLYQHRGQPLLDELSAFRTWLRVRPDDGSKFIFTSQKGGRLNRTASFRVFQQLAEAAGLPAEKRRPHVLKHTLASYLWRKKSSSGTRKMSGRDGCH